MPETPIPYFRAWVGYVVGSLVIGIPGGGLAGLVFLGLAMLAGQGQNEEFLFYAGTLVQSAVWLALSYLTFRFMIRQLILPAARSQEPPNG